MFAYATVRERRETSRDANEVSRRGLNRELVPDFAQERTEALLRNAVKLTVKLTPGHVILRLPYVWSPDKASERTALQVG
ncbi:hypothetical protein TNCV_2576501 [Trichonephila clavipes]|uniref:Uncharacterized protein n=1 Tax=Trichonephila clavipes TaxID=2585209 RepID=A0A8X6R5T2_TRICX|nr:hypothetical protein TNCV_2576501 [Trichonephila clavipes]